MNKELRSAQRHTARTFWLNFVKENFKEGDSLKVTSRGFPNEPFTETITLRYIDDAHIYGEGIGIPTCYVIDISAEYSDVTYNVTLRVADGQEPSVEFIASVLAEHCDTLDEWVTSDDPRTR